MGICATTGKKCDGRSKYCHDLDIRLINLWNKFCDDFQSERPVKWDDKRIKR